MSGLAWQRKLAQALLAKMSDAIEVAADVPEEHRREVVESTVEQFIAKLVQQTIRRTRAGYIPALTKGFNLN